MTLKKPPRDASHRVAVTVCVRNQDDRVMLVRPLRCGWELPGGPVGPRESIDDALKREVVKKFGIEIEIQTFVGIYQDLRKSLLTFAFVGTAAGGGIRASAKSTELGWFSTEQAERMFSDPAMRLRFRHLQQNRGGIAYRSFGATTFEKLMAVEL